MKRNAPDSTRKLIALGSGAITDAELLGIIIGSEDNELTRRLKDAATMIDMPMLDHLIISERGYYSFADEGML